MTAVRVRDLISGIYPDLLLPKGKGKMNVYSLLDVKLREYGPLVLANNDASVRRALCDGIPGSGGTVAKYPEDFNLMLLGTFDVETGMMVPEVVPLLVDNVAVILPPRQEGADARSC